MRVLITGAGGFIGSHLVDRCVNDGHYVVGLDRKHTADWIVGNCRCNEARSCDVFFSLSDFDFDLCYHLAAESRIQPSFDDPLQYVGSNVYGTAQVLNRAWQLGARVVYAGSSTADDDVALNVYATTKHQGEMLCQVWQRCFDLPCDIVRFYNVYGARQIEDGIWSTVVGIFERQWREGKPLTVTGDGQQRRDFTAVEDIVDGLVAVGMCGNHKAEVYNLGSGMNYSVLELARMFVDDSRIKFIPARPGEAKCTLADISRTKGRTGWTPTRNLEDYVAQVKRARQ